MRSKARYTRKECYVYCTQANINTRRIRDYLFLIPAVVGVTLLLEIPALGRYCYQITDEDCAGFVIPFFPIGIGLICAGLALFIKKRFYLTRLEGLIMGILLFAAIIGIVIVFFSGVYFR